MKKLKNPFLHLDGYNCFGCAPHNASGLRMEFFEDGDDIVSVWHPRADFQGWLNTMHGGVLCAMLDEICGWVVFRKLQTGGVTFKMETRFLRPVPTTEPYLTLRAHLTQQKRNMVFIEGVIYDSQGNACTKAVCTYYCYPQEQAQAEMNFRPCETEGEAD